MCEASVSRYDAMEMKMEGMVEVEGWVEMVGSVPAGIGVGAGASDRNGAGSASDGGVVGNGVGVGVGLPSLEIQAEIAQRGLSAASTWAGRGAGVGLM